MKNFIVQNTYKMPLSYNEWFLVKASNKKEAVSKAYELFGDDFPKNVFKAFTLEELYQEDEVVVIH